MNPSGRSAVHSEKEMIKIWGRRRSYTRATGHGRDSTETTSDSSPGTAPRIWGRAGVAA